MSHQEEWSEQAKQDLSKITGYILEKWSEKRALAFIEKVHSVVGLLLENPEIGKRSESKKDLRKLVISRQTSLIYQIKPKKIIRIVTLLDNRSRTKRY